MSGNLDPQLERLCEACFTGETAAALVLLDHCKAMAPEQWPLIEFSALYMASFCGQDATCLALLKAGVVANAPDALGRTVLMFAARNNQLEACRILVSHGADVNVGNGLKQSILYGQCDIFMHTNDTLAMAAVLIDGGADINFIDPETGSSCLNLAVSSQKESVVQLLLERGADVNVKTILGHAPLHVAASWKNTTLMRSLIHHGAHVDALNLEGKSALAIANEADHLDGIALLLAGGASPLGRLPSRHPSAKDRLNAASRLSASVYAGDARLLSKTVECDADPLTLPQRLLEAIVENEKLGKIQGTAMARSLLAAHQARIAIAELELSKESPARIPP